MQNVHLLIIDPQWDFCDPNGALSVPGADEDMKRLATFVNTHVDRLSKIHVTLDSHHAIDVGHPCFWVNSAGDNPAPFTLISADDVKNGTWTPKLPSLKQKMVDYTSGLEANGRYPLCVWPPHCLIGSAGAQIMPELHNALQGWTTSRFKTIDYVAKGSNPFTEHYSAVQADVPDPQDPGTQINVGLIRALEEADIILLAGEAGSHCLANTVRDIANNFGDESYVKKFCLLIDATSPVPSFEQLQDDFIKELTDRGMQLTTTTVWMAAAI